MQHAEARLLKLVRKLDALGSSPALVDLAEAMHSTRLSRADVEQFVRPTVHSYNRATVVAREHYELLVMTWLPGQASSPHDHAGSICVMQVVAGAATEAAYRVSGDGYVDLDHEAAVRAGDVTSGQDAGVHSVRNASTSGELLVTVHIYSPPLRDFRRFVPRPAALAGPTADDERPPTILVVGGGASGSMTAAQLLRRARSSRTGLRVILVERRGAVGEGLAYATRDPVHLLNVPAGRMSVWPDEPEHFLRWVSSRYGVVHPQDFLPRQWYGEYVRETLLDTAKAAADSSELRILFDEVRRIARRPGGGWLVHLGTGGSLHCDVTVLAIGHRPPSDPTAGRWDGPRTRLISDPWRPFALDSVREGESVVALGTGLTAIDVALSLSRRGPTSIKMVSRNGLLPQAHLSLPAAPASMQDHLSNLLQSPKGVSALALLRALRRTARQVQSAGGDWRSVIDGMRPHTAALWQNMPHTARRQFLSRLRPFWEVHRHRMAAAVAEQFGAMRERGEVQVIAGRVVAAHATGDGVRMTISERRTDRPIELRAAWVVNCTGPAPSNSAAANPAIGSLLVDKLLRPDDLGLGIETSDQGHAIDADGNKVPDLFVVGTLRKPGLWESTAVPELRQQATTVANLALELVTPSHKPVRSVSNFVWVPLPVWR